MEKEVQIVRDGNESNKFKEVQPFDGQPVMSKKRPYIACVSAKYGSERVIRAAKCIADDANVPLEVVSVLSGKVDREKLETVEYLYDIARKSGAQMTILYNDNPALAVADYIKRGRITHLIAGTAAQSKRKGDFVSLVRAVLPKVNVILIPPVSAEYGETICMTVALPPMQLFNPQVSQK